MPTKTISVFEHKEVRLPWNWSKRGVDITKSITWDEKDTTITSAKLRFTIDPNSGNVKSYVESNYSEIGRFLWNIGDSSSKSDEFDIVGNLVNGSNHFKVVVEKGLANFAEVLFVVSVIIVITYEGKDPDESSEFKKYLTYAAVGLGTAAALVTIQAGLEGKKK